MRFHALTATMVLALGALACTDDGGAETSESGSGTTGATTDTSGDGDGDPGDGDGDPGDGDPGDGDPGDGDGDPGNPNCDDPWALICEYTGELQDKIDCGVVTEADDVAAWEAAQQCALDAVAMSAGFKVLGQAYGVDSLLSWAYGGLVGETYQLMYFLHDNWGPTANYADCADIDSKPGCKVDVGDLCLRCVDASAPVLVCQ